MEKLNELLEKYFRGETTLEDERILKHYFETEQIAPEHEAYRPLFEVFKAEIQETYNPAKKQIDKHKKSIKRFWIQTISISGIAASILIAIWFQRPQQEEDYVIINGRRINNPEYAQKYAEKKINDANERIQNGLKPLRDMQVLKENIRTSHK